MKRGDIYFVNLDPTLGHEQRGRRPVVIVTLERFNRATSVPIILPITSGGDFARRNGFAVSLSGLGTKRQVSCVAISPVQSIWPRAIHAL